MQKYLRISKKAVLLHAFSPNDQMVNGEMVNGMVPSYNG